MQQEMNEKIPPICNWRGFPVVARVGTHSSFSQFRDNFEKKKCSFRKNESWQMSLSLFLKWHEFYSQKYGTIVALLPPTHLFNWSHATISLSYRSHLVKKRRIWVVRKALLWCLLFVVVIKMSISIKEQIWGNQNPHWKINSWYSTGSSYVINENNDLHPS